MEDSQIFKQIHDQQTKVESIELLDIEEEIKEFTNVLNNQMAIEDLLGKNDQQI